MTIKIIDRLCSRRADWDRRTMRICADHFWTTDEAGVAIWLRVELRMQCPAGDMSPADAREFSDALAAILCIADRWQQDNGKPCEVISGETISPLT